MNPRKTLLCSLSLCFFLASNLIAVPVATADTKQQKKVYTAKSYEREVKRAVEQAKQYLAIKVAHNKKRKHPRKLAIVLDIDETSISKYYLDRKNRVVKGKRRVILPTLELFYYAKKNDVAVFFVTARHIGAKKTTIEKLLAAGYKDWDGLYLKPRWYYNRPNVLHKTRARKKITAKGYDIVLTLGDLETDLQGGYSRRTFKLPNPFFD